MKCPICARPLEESRCETCKKTFRITLGNERGCPQCYRKCFPVFEMREPKPVGSIADLLPMPQAWECTVCNLRWTEE